MQSSALFTTTTCSVASATTLRRSKLVSVFDKKPRQRQASRRHQTCHSMPPEKAEVLKSLEPWASKNILPLLKPVQKSWQPNDLLPDPAQHVDDFTDEVRALRERTKGLSDEYFVVLVGDMITEEALPTYQTTMSNLDGVRDATASSPNPWATWVRGWSAEENRHGDLLKTYLYLSGRVDMAMVERTVQYLIGSGMVIDWENNPYFAFVYTSYQERATFVSHGNTGRLAKEGGDPLLAGICGTIAADEKRHENAYIKITEKLLEIDPNEAMLAIGNIMRNKIEMPAGLMHDGGDPDLFKHFSHVASRLGIFTLNDYADNVEFLTERWSIGKVEGLKGDGRCEQDFVCNLAPRIRKIQERANARDKKMEPHQLNFSWIFNKQVCI